MLTLSVVLWSSSLAIAVTVSTSEFVVHADPDEVVRASFMILNDDPGAVRIEISLVDWEITPDGITHLHPPNTFERSSACWLSVSPLRAALEPMAETEIWLEIHVPKEARGTYWSGLLVRAPPSNETGEAGIHVLRQFLVKVFVPVLPGLPQGEVTQLRVHGVNPLGVEVRFENTGDTFLQKVWGLVVVEDASGVPLFEMSVRPFDLLPGSAIDRFIQRDWGGLEAGVYLVRAVFDFGADYLVAGELAFRVSELTLEPIGGAATPPNDLDGDGLFEDIDGDGRLTSSDVHLLMAFLDRESIQRNARAFDFDNDGLLTPADVDRLQQIVLRSSG